MQQICLCHIHQQHPLAQTAAQNDGITYRHRSCKDVPAKPHPAPWGSSHFQHAAKSVYHKLTQHTQIQNGWATCKSQRFQNTVGQDEICNSRPSSTVLRPSLKQHRCNCQAPVISLKRCSEVLKALRSFLLDTFLLSTPCAAAQTLTCKLSDHTSAQSGDQSSDRSGCISAASLFLLKAAGH